MLRTVAIALAVSTLTALIACGSDDKSTFDDTSKNNKGDGGTVLLGDTPPAPPAVECKKMDIVFVIDNSDSMKEEQDNLAKNFPEFVKVLNDYRTAKNEELDYRVAITTTDDGKDKGKFTKSYGPIDGFSCDPGDNNAPWLERTDTSISDHFSCRAHVGVKGSNIERPLECARLSVTDRIADGVNELNGTTSFLRDDALMAFVVITDEDEGSAADPTPGSPQPAPLHTPEEYVRDFDAVKTYRGRWAAAVIAGDRGCETALGKAADATRLKQFISTTGPNGVFHSICDGDLAAGLKDALNTFANACKDFPGVN